ncbi:methyltransferase domain-containing protein [Chloroflexota bacterium]
MEQNVPGNKRCRVCSSSDIEIVYQAPLMPLGAQLVDPKNEFEPELFYPLHYAICHECGTFQSIELVPNNLLRSENTYVSATSKSVTKRDYEVFSEIQKLYNLDSKNFVVEIGGADGVFLQCFLEKNIPVLNIEPVPEVAQIARKNGIESVIGFLNEELASKVVADKGKIDLVVAKHVLELVPDLHEFVESCAIMLSENGTIMMEVPHVKDLIDGNFYDLNAHLRVYHFSLTSLVKLFSKHGLSITKVIHYESMGGGIRFYAGWEHKVSVSESVTAMLAEEKKWGVNSPRYYTDKLKRGIKLRADLLRLIDSIKKEGKRIVGFGAGIKASALLNYCGLDSRYIDYLVDNGKHKQGKLLPGVRLPIYPPGKIDQSVDYILMLAWLHQDEIIKALQLFIDNGGKIIIPTPEVKIYPGEL